jgi:hypothetical protein
MDHVEHDEYHQFIQEKREDLDMEEVILENEELQ